LDEISATAQSPRRRNFNSSKMNFLKYIAEAIREGQARKAEPVEEEKNAQECQNLIVSDVDIPVLQNAVVVVNTTESVAESNTENLTLNETQAVDRSDAKMITKKIKKPEKKSAIKTKPDNVVKILTKEMTKILNDNINVASHFNFLCLSQGSETSLHSEYNANECQETKHTGNCCGDIRDEFQDDPENRTRQESEVPEKQELDKFRSAENDEYNTQHDNFKELRKLTENQKNRP